MVTSGCVTICKDDSNLIGISIGGGAPMCPCLYIVQVKTVITAHLLWSLLKRRFTRRFVLRHFATNPSVLYDLCVRDPILLVYLLWVNALLLSTVS